MAGQSPKSTRLERLREVREGTLKGQRSWEIQSSYRRGEENVREPPSSPGGAESSSWTLSPSGS